MLFPGGYHPKSCTGWLAILGFVIAVSVIEGIIAMLFDVAQDLAV
jgi:hypothetical protein